MVIFKFKDAISTIRNIIVEFLENGFFRRITVDEYVSETEYICFEKT